MARTRLAVALVVPEPHRTEIDGLRRALGGDTQRIAPHITVVPPVNVRNEAIPDALATLRAAAAELDGPLRLGVGPGATFMPVNRVVYLAVDGVEAQLGALDVLRAGACDGVLAREDNRAFVPHVTVSNRVDADAVPTAVTALAGYRVEIEVPTVDLLAFDPEERRWRTCAEVPLGPRRIVGRGGVELELTTSSLFDPEAWDVVGEHGREELDAVVVAEPVVTVARHDGHVVGVAWGWRADRRGELLGLVVIPEHRREGIGAHVLAAFVHEMTESGVTHLHARAPGDEAAISLLEERGWNADEDLVALLSPDRRRFRRRGRG